MDKIAIGKKLLSVVAVASTTATTGVLGGLTGVVGKIVSIVTTVLAYVKALPTDDLDYYIDLVEANNSKNKTVMLAMKIVRTILACPDDDVDQTQPV